MYLSHWPERESILVCRAHIIEMLKPSIFIQYFYQCLFVYVYRNIGSFRGRLILRIQRRCSRTRHQCRPSTRRRRRPNTRSHRRPSTRLPNRRALSTRNRHHRLPLTTNTRQALTAVTSKSPTNHLANSTRSWRRLRSKTPKNRQCCTNSERNRKRTATSMRRLRITIIIRQWTLRRRWMGHRH